jgi:hypothetical protein
MDSERRNPYEASAEHVIAAVDLLVQLEAAQKANDPSAKDLKEKTIEELKQAQASLPVEKRP